MELMQLQMLVAFAEEGSVQKAAAKVFRTAPAVSIAILKLEKEIGVPILDRSGGRNFRLTAAGEVVVDYARRLLGVRDELLGAVKEFRILKRGSLRVGANQSVGEYLLPLITSTFHLRHPAVKLSVAIGYSDSVLAALKRHELDIALVASRPRDRELQSQFLMSDSLVAVMSSRYPLAGHGPIQIRDLGSEQLILLTAPSELRERVSAAFRRRRARLDVRVETGTLESVMNMASREMGVGIVPRMCVRDRDNGKLAVRTIKEFRNERSLWAVFRRSFSPACQAFMEILNAELARLGLEDAAAMESRPPQKREIADSRPSEVAPQ
jgi:DNA-binding transcriptional LysR family regulator